MGGKSPFRNYHVEAYLAGRFEDIPADILPHAKAVAEARQRELSSEAPIGRTADASEGPSSLQGDLLKEAAIFAFKKRGWGEV